MSDVSIQPAPDTPTNNEVEINPSPTNSPNAVTNTPPEVDHAAHRRSAIDRAFDRAENRSKGAQTERKAAQTDTKPAEARKGHNNPPEDTPDQKLNLKKRPNDQQEMPRGQRGQFAPRDPNKVETETNQPNQPNQPDQKRLLPESAPYRDPPPRISERARQDWDKTPETVRGDYHRMHAEFDGAYRRYRGDHEIMNTVRPFHELAVKHNTTLHQALSNYVSMEEKLRSDPIAGLDLIVHNLGLTDPQTNRPITFRDVAYHVLSRTPEQLQGVQMGNAQSAAQHQIGALHQEVAGLKNYLHQVHTQQQHAQTRSVVDQYAESHPRLDELADDIAREVSLGFDLDTAYRRADLLRPNTAAQTRNTSAQTRNVDRSIHGSPGVTSSNEASKRKGNGRSRTDALSNAYDRVMGGH